MSCCCGVSASKAALLTMMALLKKVRTELVGRLQLVAPQLAAADRRGEHPFHHPGLQRGRNLRAADRHRLSAEGTDEGALLRRRHPDLLAADVGERPDLAGAPDYLLRIQVLREQHDSLLVEGLLQIRRHRRHSFAELVDVGEQERQAQHPALLDASEEEPVAGELDDPGADRRRDVGGLDGKRAGQVHLHLHGAVRLLLELLGDRPHRLAAGDVGAREIGIGGPGLLCRRAGRRGEQCHGRGRGENEALHLSLPRSAMPKGQAPAANDVCLT
jgi:hypothetical protein